MTDPSAPVPGDATATGLARIGAGFAAVHVGYGLLSLFLVEGDKRPWLVLLDVLVALVFAATAALVAYRHWPGWRRDEAAAAIPVIAAVATAVRVELVQSAWPAAEFVLVAAAAAFVTQERRFRIAAGSSVVLAVLTFAIAVASGSEEDAAAWIGTALIVAATGASAFTIRHVRLHADSVIEVLRAQLAEQSVRDVLTGVANRAGLLLVANPMIDLARRQGEAVHCLMVDVDAVRGISETGGEHHGDALLVAVAEALRSATRTTDVIARWDGDEFVVLGPGTGTSPLEMERRIRAHLAVTATVPREAWQGRVSAGVATLVPWDADDLEGLLHRAAQDMSLRRSLRRRAVSEYREDDEPVTPTTGASER